MVALAADEERMTRTGQTFCLADLARDYGFTDVDGSIPDARKLHEQVKQNAPARRPTGRTGSGADVRRSELPRQRAESLRTSHSWYNG